MNQSKVQAFGNKALSRRDFLASSSATLTAVAFTGKADGQNMEQTTRSHSTTKASPMKIIGLAEHFVIPEVLQAWQSSDLSDEDQAKIASGNWDRLCANIHR